MLSVDELISLDKKDELAISAEEGKILMELVRKIKPGIVLEVGTGHGYSTSWIFNGWDSTIYTVDKEKRDHLFGKEKRINFLEGKLEDMIDVLPNEVDMVFLDTEHLIYKVIPDIELVVSKIKPGKKIIIHDTEYRTVLGRCLIDYFNGDETALLKEEKVSPSKLRWDYERITTEFGLGIATLK